MAVNSGRGRPPLGQRVLVVDDDPSVRALVSRSLSAEGWQVDEAADGQVAIDRFRTDPPDVVILDVVLPPTGGFAVLDELRLAARMAGAHEVPVIMLTGRGAEEDRIRGLDQGADDYMVKPFSPGELAARVRSVLRRSGRGDVTTVLDFGDALQIDVAAREVRRGGAPVPLTAKEFDLLAFLASSPRQVFSRGQLLEQVWDSRSEWQDEATVTEHVRRLRRKIEDDPDAPHHLRTVRGAGYRFEP